MSLKVYIDRLKNDDTEQISEVVKPDFLDLREEGLAFRSDVVVSGQAYLVKNHLMLDLKIKAKAQIPCSICNETTEIVITIDDFTHTVDLCEVKSAIYDFTEEVRNHILLKIPPFVECQEGNCPHRKNVTKYFKNTSQDTYSPFSEL
ncbi:MAG: hypothetical protein K1000chlam2_00856 [Chlamydiae bacterium]|nr:hypothetical protein [Chlamydiota bacterium]